MKHLRNVSIILLIAFIISCFAACNTGNGGSEDGTTTAPEFEAPTGDNGGEDDTTTGDNGNEEDTTTGGNGNEEDTTTGGNGDVTEDDYVDHEVWTDYNIISLEKAIEIASKHSQPTTKRYYIAATIKTISNAIFGEMTITDGTNELYVYGTYGADGVDRYPDLEEKPYKGDEVLLYCDLQNYDGTIQIKTGWIIDFIPTETVIDESQYTPSTIADARAAAVGTKLSVTGVVAAITYANGRIPSGVYLVDGTQSIYIYSSDIAQRVSVGNTIKVLGSRDNWILATEQNNANKFGYTGCCQLSDAYLVSNDEGNTAFDKSWITETTVKDIIDTPVTENITTTIYKVNALVKKVPGDGFVNYYFFDLDGKTGTYTYTQCNGSDFAWLDKFDGKICTVYISALNAKSTSTDCYFRFLPVHVEDNNFKFDTTKAPEFVVKYHGIKQFMPSYTGDPALELITSIDSELLGFSGATLSYSSSNTEVIYFKTDNGKTVMHCTGEGTVTVTITGSFNGATYSDTVTIKITQPDSIESGTVKEAIDAEIGDIVYVKGIVGPSVVNKSGFYIIDETGVIAVICDADQFNGLQIGHEVILKGRRENHIDSTKDGRFGQSCLMEAEIVANLYGNHDYSTATFKNATVAEFLALDIMEDHSTEVFVIQVDILLVETQHYSNLYITAPGDENSKILLYSSSASQYSWLQQFAGQTISIEVAACNWNDKTDNYRGCVLSVITAEGKVYNQLNFTSK